MRNRVERLRLWLLAGAGVLILVLAVFIGSARYLTRHFLAKLPAKLGANIKSEMNGFTYSPYDDVKRRTLYTLHAAKEVEHTDGKITLHDVSMVLYGAKGDRADRIYGDEFEYDPKAGVVRAVGLVHIDLQASEASAAAEKKDVPHPAARPGKGTAGAGEVKIIHATTSGLVYMQKLGIAATSEPIEFQLDQMTGHAIGADYNSDSGELLLHAAVTMNGIAGGRPVALTASTADLDNRDQRAFLTHAKYVSQGQTVAAEQATLHTRPDGTLARIEAQGNVTMESQGATIVSAHGDVLLNAQSQPESVLLTGGILYTDDRPLRQARGQAQEALITYDTQAKPQPKHAVFTGSVHMTERTRATEAGREPWSVRDLTAAKVDAVLVAAGPGKSELRDAEATGSPRLMVVNNGSLANAHGEGRTDLSADDLKTHLIGTGDPKQRPQIDTVMGRGHTVLRQLGADGIEQTSAGDTLDAKLRPTVSGVRPAGAASGAAVGRQVSDTLLSAVQQGHVTITRRVPAKAAMTTSGHANSGDDIQHAVAERAVYDGDLDRMMLTGSVALTDAGSELWANQVALDRETGNARAEGAVKVNYVQASSAQTASSQAAPAEPTHILADRAEMEHATQIATFYGKPVRLWQGGFQVQAPAVELARAQKRLIARGEVSTGWSTAAQAAQVHTVLLVARSDKPGTAKPTTEKPATAKPSQTGAAARSPDVARVASGGLVYSGTLDQADFTGGVRVESAEGTMLAREAIAYLQTPAATGSSTNAAPANAKAGGPAGSDAADGLSMSGRVQRVVATGSIQVEQPGRRATGERLVYTASDALYVLTGETGAPPKLVDSLRGTTVTGAALLFHAGDQSVEALSAAPGEKGTGQRVHTETRVKDEKKAGSAKH
jgi:lipopolysaccharide export system protein LptA